VKRLGREASHFVFDAALEPALEVDPGESFWVETHDAHRGTITGPEVVYETLADVFERLGGANPVTGPVAVRGVRAGDALEIAIEELVPAPRGRPGYTCTTPTLDPSLAAETTMCPLDGDALVVPTAAGALRLPLRPMVGTLAVAPAGEPRRSFSQGRDIVGNVDLPALTAGARLVVRAQVDGGLVFVGDAHLAQGDAEIHRAAIEAEADVRLSVRPADGDDGPVGLPQLNTDDAWGSIACGGEHLEELVRLAYDDLAHRLVERVGLSLADAYRVLGAAGRVLVGQVVPPLAAVLVTLAREPIVALAGTRR
jgi:acetamidase/formamidase